MKNIKRILSLVFSLSVSLLTMSVGVSSSAMSNFDNSTSDMEYLYDNDRNSYSIELFKNFISSCPSNNVGSVETTDFPDNYGGAYIDEKNVLHIKVVDSVDDGFTLKNSTNIADIKKNIGAVDVNNDVIIEEAEVSLEEMLEIQKTLDSVMVDFDISSTYTDEEKNVLGISLLDISKKDDIITYLKKNINNFNSNSVLFEQGEAISLSASDTSNNALAGSESSSSDGWATLGFNAYNSSSGKYGVVTAAHFATSGTTIYNSVGTTIGKPSVRQFSGTLDAAFVPFGSSISPSKYISQLSSPNDKLTGYYSNSSIVQGMTTTKVGGVSGVTTGTVTNASVSFSYNNITFTNQFKISNTQLAGDSGGPVFHTFIGPLQPGTTRSNTLIGIVTFMNDNDEGYGSKAANIMSGLGVSLY